jgi:hypothetical protein
MGFAMSAQHFTVFGGAYVHEARGFAHETRGFNPARKTTDGLAVWGVVLASLLFGVTTVATVTANAWAQGAGVY